jgi:mannose-6-phosphate isomerase-like protein (cupin superfamily)
MKQIAMWNQEKMERRLVRYQELIPCTTAFIDTRTPGKQKENFTIIGPGVTENPDQHVHIDIAHGFNIGGVRQEPHCVNSQHSHETAEVFIVQNSQWAFRCGVDAEDGEIIIGPGDVISIPTRVFRGFENTGNETGYMFSVLGGDDPGKVTWAPNVFETAREYGLVLLENGQLIDTANGEKVPDDVSVMPPTSREVIADMRQINRKVMQGCVYRTDEYTASPTVLSARSKGVDEIPVIGGANPVEEISAGKITWPHGFQLRCVKMSPGSVIESHYRLEEEVIYVYTGSMVVEWQEGSLELGRGDVLTIPKKLNRLFRNIGEEIAVSYVVRGSDKPAAPQWAD